MLIIGGGEPWPPTFWPSLVRVQNRDTLIEQSPVTYTNRTVIYCDIAVNSFLYSYSSLGGVLSALILCGRARGMAVTFFFFCCSTYSQLKIWYKVAPSLIGLLHHL